MKRYILSFIGLAMGLSGMAQSFTEGEFQYEVIAGGNAVAVTGYTAGETSGNIAIVPSTVTHDGTDYTVTAIGDRAFRDDGSVVAISLPATVVTIGESAFQGCTSLTFVRMSPNVAEVGDQAFAECSGMGHIDLPQTLTTLGSNALSGNTGLYTLGTDELPNLTQVGEGAFQNCQTLASIPLPPGLTDIPDNLFNGCSSLTSVSVPQSVENIGVGAFDGTSLTSIDLSNYKGSIEPRAFNGIETLQTITLPADNPYCYTSADGKAIYSREGELLSVLATAETLVIPYPATGACLVGEEQQTVYALSYDDHLPALKKLELPCTWAGASMPQAEALEELTIRSATPLWLNDGWTEAPKVYVFNYARDAFQNANTNLYGYVWQTLDYLDIDRPTEELYMQEVLPMLEGKPHVEGDYAVLWQADWNTALMEQQPGYFTDNVAGTTAIPYREFQLSQYMTDDKFKAYGGQSDSQVRCIDGSIYVTTDFDTNDYVNWYLQADTVRAGTIWNEAQSNGRCERREADPSWGLPNNEYWYISPNSATGSPSFEYALRMVPGMTYDVYVLMASRHPDYFQTEEDSVMMKNKIVATLSYNDGSASGRLRTQRSDTKEVEYNGAVQSILLFENVEVQGDWGNSVQLTTKTSASERRNGYSNSLAVVGFVAQAKEDVEILPSGVEAAEGRAVPVRYYDLQGRRRAQPQRGVNVVEMSDGSVRRIIVRD